MRSQTTPPLVGARRRGYSPEGFKLLAERRVSVLDTLKLIIDNYPAGQFEDCTVSNHQLHPELGTRQAFRFRVDPDHPNQLQRVAALNYSPTNNPNRINF